MTALSSKPHTLAVIIPMYNEEKGVERCVTQVMKILPTLKVSKARLFMTDDGSKDETPKILKQLQKKYPKDLVVVTHPKNKGYGAGLQTGAREALQQGFEFGVFMDSDLTNRPEFLPEFVIAMDGRIDCVKASRYTKGGKMVGVPFKRRIISHTGNLIASPLFGAGIKDCTNGFRMVRLEKLKKIKLRENNFSIIMEEMYELLKRGAKFKEIPNTLTSRLDTKTHFRYKPSIFWDYGKYPLKYRLGKILGQR